MVFCTHFIWAFLGPVALAAEDSETLVPGPSGVGTPEIAGSAWARALVQPLSSTLKAALESSGPVQALSVCSIQAPLISAAVAQQAAPDSGWQLVGLGRTAQKLRNPDNAPDDDVAAVLDDFMASHQSGEPPPSRVLRPDTNSLIYLQGIPTQHGCLACHGASLSPSLERRIDVLYPEDRATGFSEGELRGTFWARWELTRPAESRLSNK